MPQMPDGKKVLYIIDGYAQIYRAYHAIRSLNSPVTGEPTNATFGFVGMLLRLMRECRPDYLVVALDIGGDKGTFRSEIFPEYKATRSPPPDDFRPQVDRILELCRLWNIPVIGAAGYEADDVIATLCRRLGGREDLAIRIVSRDKDLEQLLSPSVSLYDVHTTVGVDVDSLLKDKGIKPGQVADVLALMGDKVDNIPGAAGVGPKTAAKLIARYGSLQNLLSHTHELSGKLKENIEAVKDRLPLSHRLVTLCCDVPVDLELDTAAVRPPPVDSLRPIFKQLGFSRHLTDLEALAGDGRPAAASTPVAIGAVPLDLFSHLEPVAAPSGPAYQRADPANYRTIRTEPQLEELGQTLLAHARAGGVISIDTETDSLDPMRARLCGVCIAWTPGSGVYVPTRSCEQPSHLTEDVVVRKLRPILEDPNVVKVGHNLKFDMLVLRRAGVELAGVGQAGFDTMVASYLIDATRTSHKLDNVALSLLDHEMIPITDLIGRGRNSRSMFDVPVQLVTTYGAEDADIALRLYEKFAPQLRAMGLGDLFRDLEMPLVEVLAELEHNGVLVDPDELDRQKVMMDKRIEELREEIATAAGHPFNPDSPRQLAEVMFKKLKARIVKRGQTGPSTDSEVLQRIADEQPPPQSIVASLILEYRQLAKLRTTYLQSLKEAINPQTSRIHASFNQTITSTGRLSSSDPNLQNIPIRTELGRQVRRAFLAPAGHVLLSADYSQIELRLLAHFSGDERLIEAFEKDLDIHTAVAAEVFGVPADAVSPEQRAVAKMVNFGIVYGITPFGLARRLPPSAAGSSVDVAAQIIADYKKRYPKIDHFLSRCVEQAMTRGYVQTIAGRRRPVPEINARNPQIAAFGRRIAINSVVQGSAADLIKIAMVRLHGRIRGEGLPMKMLMQIHDELVFEVPQDQVHDLASRVRQEMEQSLTLAVPIKVDLAWGQDWYAAQ